MCGIMGYVGGKNAAEIVYGGLQRLEYRGYDSAGVALLNDDITVVKKQGRVSKLLPYLKHIAAPIGIGHTRWATHGKPSDANAHPHLSGGCAVVHNGIIENYAEIKSALIADGETFLSETDSEVIAVLIRRNFSGDLLAALRKTCNMLTGSYALMVICKGVEGIAVAANRSPVIIGFGKNENFCASDEPALAGLCAEYCVLKDGDFAFITDKKVDIYDGDLKGVKREIFPLSAKPQNLDLGGYPHYMLKEMNETPAAVKNTLSAFSEVEEKIRSEMDGVGRIIFTGCGTAYHAGLIGKRYAEIFARIPAEAETAGEFRYKDPVITPETAVVAISQSGETADTLEAARLALSLGAKVIAVTNAPHSALTRIATVVVPVCAGTEICVCATKSYAGQIAALYMLALTLAKVRVYERYPNNIPELLQNFLKDIDVYSLSHMCVRSKGVFFLGRDLDYAVALEASLKLKEITYIHSEGYPAGELKHGTLAVVDGGAVCVFIITDKRLAAKSGNAVEQVVSRGAAAAVITDIEEVAARFKGRAEVIKLPQSSALASPLFSALVLQKLAYTTAVILGNDPDKPRHLAKSVTVE